MIKAFIFDFDGLIIDTETATYQSWEEIYKTYNINLPLSKWELIIGTSNHAFDPLEYLAEQTSINLDKPEILSRYENNLRDQTRSLSILPGVLRYLTWAKKNLLTIALASSSSNSWVTSNLKRLGIDNMFDVIRTSDDVENVKPNPELFLSVKTHLNIEDYEAVVFEDSQNGVIAANKARFFTIAVPNAMTKNMDFSVANFILNSLDAVAPQNLVKILENNLKTGIV